MKDPRANALGTSPNIRLLSGTFNHRFPSCHDITYNNSITSNKLPIIEVLNIKFQKPKLNTGLKATKELSLFT